MGPLSSRNDSRYLADWGRSKCCWLISWSRDWHVWPVLTL